MPLEGEDVVLLYGPPWDGAVRLSKHHLARYLAEHGNRVLFVEAPLSTLSVARRRSLSEVRDTLRPLRRVARNLWVRRYLNPIPYHSVSRLTSLPLANRLGQRLIAVLLRRDLERLGMRRPILIAGLPHAVDLIPRLPCRALVYHCADDYVHATGFPASLPALEARLCAQADLVITTERGLGEDRKRLNPRTHWIPNGVDAAHFGQAAVVPSEMARFVHPVVGYVGGISEWVDVELVAQVARSRPEWSFVLVGPVERDMQAVAGLSNVHLLGARPYESLPGYLAGMDVAIVPFERTPLTERADPIKVYEYLAAGLPVVSTRLPALERLAHVIRLCDSPSGYLAALDAAVAAGRDAGREERQREAQQHTWNRRFDQLAALLEERLAS